jgi:hypothetical protein
MAAGADHSGAALRVTLACLLDPASPVPGADQAGAAAVAEVLVRRLTRDGLVQPAATGKRRPRHHELSPAGVNAAMAG